MDDETAMGGRIKADLRLLCDEAEAAGKWLKSNYQGILFSPADLRAENDNGKFLWGRVNWSMVDPMDDVLAARNRAAAATQEADRLEAKIKTGRVWS